MKEPLFTLSELAVLANTELLESRRVASEAMNMLFEGKEELATDLVLKACLRLEKVANLMTLHADGQMDPAIIGLLKIASETKALLKDFG